MLTPVPVRTTVNAPRRIWSTITQNIGLKILSLMCALIVYGLVHGTSEVQRTVVVGVVGMMPPASANRVLVRPLQPSVRVTIRGAKAALDELKADDLGTLQVDLRNADGMEVKVEVNYFVNGMVK